jgi:hypothetical protein
MKKRDYLMRFSIAGFSYYEGAIAFQKLNIGTKLTLKPEQTNIYDKRAVEIYFENFKLGYLPKHDNKVISALLKSGINPFDARVQTIRKNEHPENQIGVILYFVTEIEKVD